MAHPGAIDTEGDVSDRVLTALLARLDTEPALVGALLEDPAGVLERYGLPDEDVEPLITWLRDRGTGDPDVVARRVAGRRRVRDDRQAAPRPRRGSRHLEK